MPALLNVILDVLTSKKCTHREQINNLDLSNFYLKVPKREIFDRSDFPDFYTIKSLREGDFGVKI